MIRSKSEYKEYYLCDLRKTGIINKNGIIDLLIDDLSFIKHLGLPNIIIIAK